MPSIFGKNIYIEGVDFSGKSNLIHDLLPYSINNNNFLSDRSIVTSIIYGKYFNRNLNFHLLEKEFENYLNSNSSFFLFLNTELEELIRRSKIREEKHININDLEVLRNFYIEFFNKYSFYENIRIINSHINIINNVIKIDNEFNVCKIICDYSLLLKTLYNKCIIEKSNYSEINNFVFNFFYKNYSEFLREYFEPTHFLNEGFEYFEIFKNVKLKKIDREKIYKIEKYEQNMILSNLKFNTHIMMSKYDEKINSRRFISINDSCFSFTQVLIRDDDVFFTFVFRSSEVYKMLISDLKFIGNLIREYYCWIYDYSKIELNEKKINIRIQINNAHLYRE